MMPRITKRSLGRQAGNFWGTKTVVKIEFLLDGKAPVTEIWEDCQPSDPWVESFHTRQDAAVSLRQLRKNDYKVLTKYCKDGFSQKPRFICPLKFLEWVKRQEFSLQKWGEFFAGDIDDNGFVEFHGNLSEYSSAFCFRIFDRDLLELVKERVSRLSQTVYFERR